MCLIGVIAFTSTAKNYALSHQSSLAAQNLLASSTASPVLSGVDMTRGGVTRLFQSSEIKPDQASLNASSAVSQTMLLSDPSLNRGPLKVLFLSSDTGGGHRASAMSLAKQFEIHFPGSTYDLVDVWTLDGVLPYRTLVNTYKHLSAHPRQWRFLFHLSNTFWWEWIMNKHSSFLCERRIRKRIASYDADVIVSVHPTMNVAPLTATHRIAKAAGKHIPFYTVVTDLGSAHCTWFTKKIDKVYVASDRLYSMAAGRAKTPQEKIVRTGLPIRYDFAAQAEYLGDRTTDEGKAYQASIRAQLDINPEKPMILLMGGGEGVGSLATITEQIHQTFVQRGIDATICVVCGRNEKLKAQLGDRDWSQVSMNTSSSTSFSGRRRLFRLFRRRGAAATTEDADSTVSAVFGNVTVVPLGFVTNMAEYMAAADVLISKAGPGTLAEAASVGLPVMMTSFLPGQEAGNVDFVLEHGFGAFHRKPIEIADEAARWLEDPKLWAQMSHNALKAGKPHAAADIVLDIGSSTHTWMALNDGHVTTTVEMAREI